MNYQQSILVVDDKPSNLLAMKHSLVGLSVEVITATSGDDALRATLNHDFALCIVDVHMPDMSGYELAKILKTDPATHFLPIIFLTAAHSAQEHVLRGYEVGGVDYFTKPYDPFVLRSKLTVFLELDRQRAELVAQRQQLETITAQLRQEIREREERDRLIQQQAKALELGQTEKLVALGRLAASVTHELNQPLNAIGLICGDIRRDFRRDQFDVARLGDSMDDICSQIGRMSEIVDHVRTYARKGGETEKHLIDARAPVDSALGLLHDPLRRDGIQLSLEVEEGLSVLGDRVKLEQVFINLLTNARDAVKHNDQAKGQKIDIQVGSAPSSNGKPTHVLFAVSDNGSGIPEAVRDQIFQPFFTSKEAGEGTGLGLSVSKGIVEEHEGEITVESVEGEGTTFRVIIPAFY